MLTLRAALSPASLRIFNISESNGSLEGLGMSVWLEVVYMFALCESTIIHLPVILSIFIFSSPSAKPLKRASRVKSKTKSHPQKATMNTDSSNATLCPQTDLVCHHHGDNSGVMVGNISTTNCETEHPGVHTCTQCTKDISEFKGFSPQNSVSVLGIKAAPTRPHVHHKGTSKATGSASMCSTHRLQFSHLENSNTCSHQPLQLVQELPDGKPIT